MPGVYTIREHDKLPVLDKRDLDDLIAFTKEHRQLPVFHYGWDGHLRASNYVGVITTKRGTVVEILPKIDLGESSCTSHERTREAFLMMLRTYGGLKRTKSLPPSAIRALRRFPLLEVFVHLFLENVGLLVRGGLGRQYRTIQENLSFLRGRIVFRDHLRENLIDRSRFYVEHDELNPNRPANRLIRTTLDRLKPIVREGRNRRLLADLEPAFSAIPTSQNVRADWRSHSIDRCMRHYEEVMQWVELFLFNQGLTTYSGRHINQSLLFPMEQVYEDFVTHGFRRYQTEFQVVAQGPGKRMLQPSSGHNAMKPDISLCKPSSNVRFILDAKWIHLGENENKTISDVHGSDLYQIYAYGKRYKCQTVALVYPRNSTFIRPCNFQFFDGLKLVLLPFDVSSPAGSQRSVQRALRELECEERHQDQ